MKKLLVTLAVVVASGAAAHAKGTPPSDNMDRYAAAIRKIESTGRYHVTANAGNGRRALGAYQILDSNLPSWSQAALGRKVSASEFLSNPGLQDRIFRHRFAQYVSKYGADGAAKAWLGGEGAARGRSNKADRFGSTPDSYARRFRTSMR